MSNRRVWQIIVLLLAVSVQSAAGGTATFEDLTLSPESSYDGSDGQGGFTSQGIHFTNVYDTTYGTWSGFIYSNKTDTTTGDYSNQSSSYAGSGAGGSANYGVAFGYIDLQANDVQPVPFDPTDAAQRDRLPHFALPSGSHISSVAVTNATYAALSMLDGDSFAKKFGGPTGDDPDYLKITAYGTTSDGTLLAPASFYLADFRFADNSLDYIVRNWTSWDLSALSDATQIYFNLSGSDSGRYGLNTPTYFAIDNIQFVPEPSSLVLALIAAVIGGAFTLRRV